MLSVLGLIACLCTQPQAGVLPSVPTICNPWEVQGNRHARRRDAKRNSKAGSR